MSGFEGGCCGLGWKMGKFLKMRRTIFLLGWSLFLGNLLGGAVEAGESFAKSGVEFLQKHCTECHGQKKQKGEVVLDGFRDEVGVLKQRKAWKRILAMVEQGEMPPEEKLQPTKEEREEFLRMVRGVFKDNDLKARPDPGRVTVRRLNRSEYNNTLRDLLGVDIQPANDFPSDGVGYGFDNIGEVLSLSPLLMERYLDAAQAVADQVIPLINPKPNKRRTMAKQCEPAGASVVMRGDWREFSLGKDGNGSGAMHTGFQGKEGGSYLLRAEVYGEVAAGKKIRVALVAWGKGIEVAEGEERLRSLELGEGSPLLKCRILGVAEVTATEANRAQVVEAKLSMVKGVERVGLVLVRDGLPDLVSKIGVRWLEVVGPEDTRSAFLQRWSQASPGATPEQKTRVLLSYFMPRAWHRPIRPDEIERVGRLADSAMKREGSWEAGVRQALVAVLSSPKFLFRLEIDDEPENLQAHPINAFQLATRLSYFLWSSCPDDELLGLALSNRLTEQLDQQILRMLKDPRAETLVDNFGMQWLQLRRLSGHQADGKTYGKWNVNLRDSMLKETRLFFAEIIRENRSVLDLLEGDFTYLDSRLGELYGIKPPGGFEKDKFRRVSLVGSERGGILTQASILTVTSNPTRTSPVKRGKWILEQIFGDPPPPPPAGVPSLDDENRQELSGTFRQRLEQHRADAKCANCHAKMDTMGLALENFDGIGGWRDRDELGQPIEVGGKLPNGENLKSLSDFKKLIRGEREVFLRCLTEKLMIYALGRGLEDYDDRAIEKIQGEVEKSGYSFSSLVSAIVKSDGFRLRRGKGQNEHP